MKGTNFQHPLITGLLCELVRTLDFEMTWGDELWPIRIELYQGVVDRSWFRCRVWQAEYYRIQATFPQDSGMGEPKHDPSDEMILVDWSTNLPKVGWFQAETPERAIEEVLALILDVIERITGEGQEKPGNL
jgi:hypothetical protein